MTRPISTLSPSTRRARRSSPTAPPTAARAPPSSRPLASRQRNGDEAQVALGVLDAQQHGLAPDLLHLLDAARDVLGRRDLLLRRLDDDVARLDVLGRGGARRIDLGHDDALHLVVDA